MTRQQSLWLTAAGIAAAVIVFVVLAFGYTRPPSFPSLYDDGPQIEGLVAHLDYGRQDCVSILDVATGSSEELYCDSWVWAERWDADGNLLIHAGNGHEQIWVVDPETGAVLDGVAIKDGPTPEDEDGPGMHEEPELRMRSVDGRLTLTHGSGVDAVTVVDVEAPRNYTFFGYGITNDGSHAWVCDSEDRLLVASLDGTGGPWLVAEGISDPIWR